MWRARWRVATQDPKRQRALHIPTKTERVVSYQQGTVEQAMQVVASMGCHSFEELKPHMLRRRIDHGTIKSYADLFPDMADGQLLRDPPPDWERDWAEADPNRFIA